LRPPKLVPDPPNFFEFIKLLAAPTAVKGFFNMLMTAGPELVFPLEIKKYS
jgi:hypothetical protein